MLNRRLGWSATSCDRRRSQDRTTALEDGPPDGTRRLHHTHRVRAARWRATADRARTIHLDAYSVETGERRWWMPVGSVGAMGTVVASKDGGIIASLNATTGGLLKEGRSADALGQYFASPVAADHKVYFANTEGKITVLKAGPQWEVLGVNDLGEEIDATPALAGGWVYVRTRTVQYCFGAKGSGSKP